ncbi:MAG TPA: universal stress protein [Candidatus Acidoferrales bacterium]|jgi:nucleotide-binding universal stress UspA family protein|nr:universal stress protein [Candidatus Acidoferrales bacterium]
MKTLDARTRVQLKNILFTTDFSAAAAAALPCAGALAKRFGAKLFALHVRTPVINPMTPPEGWPALVKAAAEEDRERKESLRNALPGVETTVLIEEGDIGAHLPATVKKEHIDLIVLGTRGRTGMGKLMLGSGAEEILRTAECPVLTVGPLAPGIPAKYREFTRILYATSFGCEIPAAAAYAISLAQEFQADLTLLHVLPEPQVGEFVVPQDLMESSKRRLAHLLPPEAEMWCVPEVCVERGNVAEKILDVAKRRNADLIVLGIRKPTGVPGAATHLPIATAHKVVSHAHCPVLTVRD